MDETAQLAQTAQQPDVQKKSLLARIRDLVSFLKDFYRECLRVLKVTKKPDKETFTTIVKVSGIGMGIIGIIGFLIRMIEQILIK